MATRKGICRHFNTPEGCRFGERCKFSHGTGAPGNTRRSQRPANKLGSKATEFSSDLQQWRSRVNRFSSARPNLAEVRSVLVTAKELMDSKSSSTLQEVVRCLAEEQGLRIVRLVADLQLSTLREVVLPFCEVLCHPDAVNSLVLEQAVGTIYNVIYGPSGRKASALFGGLLRVISGLKSSPDQTQFEQTFVLTLELFSHVLIFNQTAAVNEELIAIAHQLEECGNQSVLKDEWPSLAAYDARQCMNSIRRRLNFAAKIPDKSDDVDGITEALANFTICQEPPGTLSSRGPRHDNDSADIASIQILPTSGEVWSNASEYLPERDPRTHHIAGAEGLLDRQFRLLREDTVGQLRDRIHDYVRNSASHQTRDNRMQSVRTTVFKNASFVKTFIDKRAGLTHLVAFDQPAALNEMTLAQRSRYWTDSPNLKDGSLICFMSNNQDITFFTVGARQPLSSDSGGSHANNVLSNEALKDLPISLHQDRKRAYVALQPVNPDAYALEKILKHQTAKFDQKSSSTLVEFPGILLASFQHTLEALQNMSKAKELPFSDLLAPSLASTVDPVTLSQLPQYVRRPGFSYDLSKIANGEEIRLSPGRSFDSSVFQKASGLDASQVEAFTHALLNRFALIQGPPGTGKSYVGVQIVRTLLEHQKASMLGPMLCVCYTNHALDQMLEHLIDRGVKQIVRIGGRSKSDKLAEVNLAKLSTNADKTKYEKHQAWQAHGGLDALMKEIPDRLRSIQEAGSVVAIRRHLQNRYPHYHRELFSQEEDEVGWKTVRPEEKKILKSWLRGGFGVEGASTHETSSSRTSRLSHMPNRRRHELYQRWISEIQEENLSQLPRALSSFNEKKGTLDKCHMETKLRILQQAQVIGITTTGLAKNIELLRRLKVKVLIIEEAGEIMEAHMLPVLLPGMEHVIAIGDHQQLRPQIANYDLSVESSRGERYSLDVSLFERLIYPADGSQGLPYTTLQTQRRMHPSISRLIQRTIYSKLENHPSVEEHPAVVGLRQRLYWLDHKHPEDSKVNATDSKSNVYEVEMTAALASHLVKQGAYAVGQITVLTPYLAQLRELRRRLGAITEIVIGDRDKDELEAAGLQEEEETRNSVRKSNLGAALCISTVDNYQGEESDVVIVSLVRSNSAGKVGFLRTSNRINVLLSRARHGMYIIGNASTARTVDMWNKVIKILEADSLVGQGLIIDCPRHPEAGMQVSCPEDFSRYSPEGGCDLICDKRLICGHACVHKCHAQHLHEAVICQNPCQRLKNGCTHPCNKVCGLKCDEKCQTMVQNIQLPCGHVAASIKCWQSQDLKEYPCPQRVTKVVHRCSHTVEVPCWLDVSQDFDCTAVCSEILGCGHKCKRRCSECTTFDDDGKKHINHGVCTNPCNRDYSVCPHQCKQDCHGGTPCKACTQPCTVRCVHSACHKQCYEPCDPCAEPCPWECPHRGRCDLPCSVPCERLPCSERCTNTLECGHQCPSICGEICPGRKFCQVCGDEAIKEAEVDFISYSSYKELDLSSEPVIIPPCGHLRAVTDFDGMMHMPSFYNIDEEGKIQGLSGSLGSFEVPDIKSCAMCRGSLRMLNRYSRIVKQALIDEATKRFIIWARAEFAVYESRGHSLKKQLSDSVSEARFSVQGSDRQDRRTEIKEGGGIEVVISGSAQKMMKNILKTRETAGRYNELLRYRSALHKFCIRVSIKEQPFRRIWDMQRLSRISKKDGEDGDSVNHSPASSASMLNTRDHLMARSLLLQTDASILADFTQIWSKSRASDPLLRDVWVDASGPRAECAEQFARATEQDQPVQQVEALLLSAFFTAAELRCPREHDVASTEQLRKAALNTLADATAIINAKPSAKKLEAQVDSARRSLMGEFHSVVTDDEMRAVYAAMAAEFHGTGHWYRCANGHPFTIGECGMPMELARCPQCDSPVGGRGHVAVEGVRAAEDIERNFGGFGL